MRTYAQATKTAWDFSGSLIAGSSINSGCFASIGYARLTGVVYSDASMSGVCGIKVRQSSTSTPNWDHESVSALSACSGSMFGVEIVGRYADIQLFSGATCAASVIRSYWALRPI